jgi:hypothetical protein
MTFSLFAREGPCPRSVNHRNGWLRGKLWFLVDEIDDRLDDFGRVHGVGQAPKVLANRFLPDPGRQRVSIVDPEQEIIARGRIALPGDVRRALLLEFRSGPASQLTRLTGHGRCGQRKRGKHRDPPSHRLPPSDFGLRFTFRDDRCATRRLPRPPTDVARIAASSAAVAVDSILFLDANVLPVGCRHRPWLFQAPAGSYQFSVAIQEPRQPDFFKDAGPQPRRMVRRAPATGVRKPPREMLWGGGEDIASIGADVNRWSPPCGKLLLPTGLHFQYNGFYGTVNYR